MKVRRFAVAAALLIATGGCGGGQDGTAAPESASGSDIAMYSGPDRQQRLLEGAKAEKELLWYTTIIPDQLAQPLVDAFKAKYPFANVRFFRANSTEVAQRAVQEYQGKRHEVDLVDGTGSASLLRKAGILQPFRSPELDTFGAELKDPEGYWAAELQYFMVAGGAQDARGSAGPALEGQDGLEHQPHLRRAPVHRQRAGDDGGGEGQGVPRPPG